MSEDFRRIKGSYKSLGTDNYEEYFHISDNGIVKIIMTRNKSNEYDRDEIEIISMSRPLKTLVESDFKAFSLYHGNGEMYKSISYNDFLFQYKKAIRNIGDHFGILEEDKMSANRKIQKRLDKIIDGSYYKVDEY